MLALADATAVNDRHHLLCLHLHRFAVVVSRSATVACNRSRNRDGAIRFACAQLPQAGLMVSSLSCTRD